jgi:hypothetical protein
MIGVIARRPADVVHKRRTGRADVVDDQFCYRVGSLSGASICFQIAQTISSPHCAAGWALVGGLFFRHRLVVEPSECLLHHSAWLQIAFGRTGQGFLQFTQFNED